MTQIRRYSRHILLPDVGGIGQDRLLAATVTLIITGPASCITAAYLVAAGVGTLRLSGPDRSLAAADLLYPFISADLGAPLLPTLAARLSALNPDTYVVASSEAEGPVEGPTPLAEAMARGGEEAARIVWRIAVGRP